MERGRRKNCLTRTKTFYLELVSYFSHLVSKVDNDAYLWQIEKKVWLFTYRVGKQFHLTHELNGQTKNKDKKQRFGDVNDAVSMPFLCTRDAWSFFFFFFTLDLICRDITQLLWKKKKKNSKLKTRGGFFTFFSNPLINYTFFFLSIIIIEFEIIYHDSFAENIFFSRRRTVQTDFLFLSLQHT